jgi:hypothetical protein
VGRATAKPAISICLSERQNAGCFRESQKECSFLKKRTKKLFSFMFAGGQSATARAEIFCFFFSKKKTFLTEPRAVLGLNLEVRVAV